MFSILTLEEEEFKEYGISVVAAGIGGWFKLIVMNQIEVILSSVKGWKSKLMTNYKDYYYNMGMHKKKVNDALRRGIVVRGFQHCTSTVI